MQRTKSKVPAENQVTTAATRPVVADFSKAPLFSSAFSVVGVQIISSKSARSILAMSVGANAARGTSSRDL